MANIKISELPQINFSSITNNDIIPIVNVISNTTSKVLISDLKTFFNTLFTGGTVSGLTEFTNGLVSNTISATTYQNLPIDVFVTGGTYSNGVTTFTNNIGGTFSVSGYFTGYTNVVNTLTTSIGLSADTTNGDITIINTLPDQTVILNDGNNISVVGAYPNFTINVTGLTDNDRYVTGFSYSNNTFTIGDNSGNTYDATFNDVTGLTVNGTLSATTISGGTLYGDGSNLTNLPTFTGGTTIEDLSAVKISATTISGDTFYGDGSNLTNLPTFTGGTISDLTATTVSATTYENLPETIPYYANSLWTSFQNSVRATNSTNFGSNSSIGVGFNIPNNTRIKSAKLEISLFSVGCDGYLSIHKVENGIITERLWQEQYNIVGTGIYTFTGMTLDLVAGNYAYATNQTIIQGYRSINLENDNIFGLIPTLGTSPYITGKSAGIVNVIPNPYPISQIDYFGSVPLVIFEIELI